MEEKRLGSQRQVAYNDVHRPHCNQKTNNTDCDGTSNVPETVSSGVGVPANEVR